MFAELGHEERSFLHQRGIIQIVSDFIKGTGSFAEEEPKSKAPASQSVGITETPLDLRHNKT